MGPLGARLDRLAQTPLLPILAVLIMAIRFAGPSASAFLGVEGFDTSRFDTAMLWYDGFVPLLAGALIAAVVAPWPRGFGLDRWILLAVLLVVADVVLWLGEADSALRFVEGPWAILPLGVTATATIAVCGAALEVRLRRGRFDPLAREGFRALYLGFAAAYLLGTLRFIDYRYALGVTISPGALWLLDYGPVILLGLSSAFVWVRIGLPTAMVPRELAVSLVFPLLGIAAGMAVSEGLAGFILSNTLAWGGAYEVFIPTAVSIGFVGFSVGCFLATAWTLRGRMPRPGWRFLVAGILAAALAGIVAFGGTLGSVAGILLGLVFAARGLVPP